MLDITILAIGPLKEASLRGLAAEYQKRLKPFVRLELIELGAAAFGSSDKSRAKETEAAAIEEYLAKRAASNRPAKVYLLAERGKIQDSGAFAGWLDKEQPLILVVGGALGFSDSLYAKYPQVSLSSLTFPHELARVILLEQIYRAATLLNDKDYHY